MCSPASPLLSSTSQLTLDPETVNQVIIPDLEGYDNEVRLRGHLSVRLLELQSYGSFLSCAQQLTARTSSVQHRKPAPLPIATPPSDFLMPHHPHRPSPTPVPTRPKQRLCERT